MSENTSETIDLNKQCIPFGECLLSDRCPPLVFRGAIDQWPSLHWTPGHLALVLDRKFQCKICPVNVEDMLWETECLHQEITLSDYCDWLNQKLRGDNPLSLFDPGKYSCYIDYKYMKEMFKDTPEILKEVCWDAFGLSDRDGRDSTIWIGSSGAYTPCHQDSYGFNLVAQLYGSKRWYLFPPWQSDNLYPTRIPFEESSVYSKVNVRFPDLHEHAKFQSATPYVVTLTPGQVLFVPRHWWHFVECTDSAISVNTWVPMEADVTSRLQEAVCKLLVTALSPMATDGGIINTNEELQQASVNFQYIQTAYSEYKQTRTSTTCTPTDDVTQVEMDANPTSEIHEYEHNRFVQAASSETNLKTIAKHFVGNVIHCASCNRNPCHLEYSRKRRNEQKGDNKQDGVSDGPSQKNCKLCSNESSLDEVKCKCRVVDEYENVLNVTSDTVNNRLPDSRPVNTDNADVPSALSVFVGRESLIEPDKKQTTPVTILQLHPISFDDFIAILEKEFSYESSCVNTLGDSLSHQTTDANGGIGSKRLDGGDAVRQSAGDCGSGNGSPVVSVNDVINSILDPSVIRHICDVLVENKGK